MVSIKQPTLDVIIILAILTIIIEVATPSQIFFFSSSFDSFFVLSSNPSRGAKRFFTTERPNFQVSLSLCVDEDQA
jgi:hypothetical protein